jgi:hypothetical protein
MDVTERILAEYRDLPGLRLTTRQAARLWALDLVHCERLLRQLVTDGHLCIDAIGQYTWISHVHVPHTRASEPRDPRWWRDHRRALANDHPNRDAHI